MTIERTGRVTLTVPLRQPPERRPTLTAGAAPPARAAADAALARGAADDGVASRLSGLQALGRPLVPGELIAVRVLATAPAVELGVEANAPPGRANAPSSDLPDAMKPDQLALRHLHWRAPSALDLASSIRAQVFQRLTAELALRESLPAQAMPRMVEHQGVTYDMPLPAIGPERWGFPVHLAGGQQALLRVADRNDNEDHAAAGSTGSAVVLLEVEPPGLGRIRVRLLVAAGAHLHFCVECDEAVAHVRGILPSLAATLAYGGVRLASCRMLRTPARLPRSNALDITDASALHTRLSLPLFRLATEVLFALTSPLPARP